MAILIARNPIPKAELAAIAKAQFGNFIKAVVDVERGVMAVGGELHADEEALLIEEGSRQEDLWGINLYLAKKGTDFIEFDSMINVRPSQGNNSRNVEDQKVQEMIRGIVNKLVKE